MTTMVMGSPGPIGWVGSGGGGSRADLSAWSCEGLTSDGLNGSKLLGTIALGMTETARGLREARRVVFSLLGPNQWGLHLEMGGEVAYQVCETQTTWLTSLSENLSSLFAIMLPASLKPKSE